MWDVTLRWLPAVVVLLAGGWAAHRIAQLAAVFEEQGDAAAHRRSMIRAAGAMVAFLVAVAVFLLLRSEVSAAVTVSAAVPMVVASLSRR